MKIYDKKLAYPYFVWMVLFTVVPLFIVVYYALTDASGSFTLDNLVGISGYGSVFARSLLLALIATVVCLVLAFPVGYFLSRLRVNKQHIMLMLVMLPMWMNFLLRTYAWMGLLSINGPVNAVLGVFGLGPYNMLNTSGAVVLGMVYNYVPYMILPLYTSMTKIDQSIVEAAQDLGASTTKTLLSEKFGKHPAVKMWHISNELSGECHCPLCQKAFQGWLKKKYQTIDALNMSWNTTFWSCLLYTSDAADEL